MARRKPVKPLYPYKHVRRMPERSRALREMLQEQRRAVREELDTLSRSLREGNGSETWDEGDLAVSEFNRDLGRVRINQLTQQLVQIEEALVRQAEGRYGRCAACNAEIPLARLRSWPVALYCRDCQEAAETASGQAAHAGA